MQTTAAHLSKLVDGHLIGDPDTPIAGAATVDEAGPGDVVPAENGRYLERALASEAACVIARSGDHATAGGRCVIEVDDPAAAFAKVLECFQVEEALPEVGVAVGASVASEAVLGREVRIAANCFVGSGAILGDDCVLFPGACVGESVKLGKGCKLYPNVTVYAGCKIGDRVVLHAGVVIGADGFGYRQTKTGAVKVPHIGTVVIGDDVEIGPNSTIDRAKTGATVIGSGTKIDNLVHVAHNVKIGANCAIVALSGIAGSAEIADNVLMAAQTGVSDHVRIGDGCVLAARAGVIGDLPAGSIVSGFPARDHRLEKRVEAARLHLPEVLRRLKKLESELAKLSGRQCGNGDAEH